MMDKQLIEFLKKPHTSMEELLEDLMDIDLYIDDDDEFKIEDLGKLDQLDEDEDEDSNKNSEPDDSLNDKDEISDEDISQQTEIDSDTFNDLDSILNIDDNEKSEEDEDNDNDLDFDEDEQEQEKDKFLYNIRQLIKIRDLLNIAISKTNEKEFIILTKYVNRILSTVANIGDEMYEREDLAEINEKLELFMKDIVDSAKKILQDYEEEQNEEKMDDNLDFDFLDLKGGK